MGDRRDHRGAVLAAAALLGLTLGTGLAQAAGAAPRKPPAPPAAPRRQAPRVDAVTPSAPVGEEIEIGGEHLGEAGRERETEVRFFAGKNQEPLAVPPTHASARRLRVVVPRGALPGPVRVRTAGGESAGSQPFTPLYRFHVPPDVFTGQGPLAALDLTGCAIVLADGVDGSLVRVSPGMAAAGFRDVTFTIPAYSQAYDIGIGTVGVRVRIPGSDVADRYRTLQTDRVDLRVAGPRLVLTAHFESEGPEFVGEVRSRTTFAREVPWTPFLNIDANDLVVQATFPLVAKGLLVGFDPTEVRVDFAFHVTALSAVRVDVDDATVKQYIAGTVRDRLKAFLDHEAYREPLARAVGLFLVNNPAFSGVIFNRVALETAADGGLDVRALTPFDP